VILILISLLITIITSIVWNIIDLMPWWGICIQIITEFVLIILSFIILCILISLCLNTKKKVVAPKKFFVVMNYVLFDFIRILFRVKVDFKGEEKVDYSKNYLLICNHQSNLDPFVILPCLYKLNISFIIKKEIHKLFFLKGWTNASGFYPLDRSNNRSAIQVILQTIEAVQEHTICVFPEGTRSKDGKLLDFKEGIFRVAQKGKVDILVCTIDGICNVKKRFPFRSTKVKFEVSGVIKSEEIVTLSTKEIGSIAKTMIENSLLKVGEKNK